MKKTYVLVMAVVLVVVFFAPQATRSEHHTMTESQQAALDSVGFSVYPGASFLTSDEDGHIVVWFASADSPDTIMDWYEENLSEWSAATISGRRIIYRGPDGLSKEEIMTLPYVFVSTAEQLGNDPADDNEITVRIPASP